jgi:hypothetical protein
MRLPPKAVRFGRYVGFSDDQYRQRICDSQLTLARSLFLELILGDMATFDPLTWKRSRKSVAGGDGR